MAGAKSLNLLITTAASMLALYTTLIDYVYDMYEWGMTHALCSTLQARALAS